MMKQKILFGLVFWVSTTAWAIDPAVDDINALCALAKNGKASEIKVEAVGSKLRLLGAGVKGKVLITQQQYEGLQTVLDRDRARDNESYRQCVKEALPYFKTHPNATPQPPAPPIVTTVPVKPAITPVITPPPTPAAEIIDNRYQILANGAEVKDLQTNLIWQRCQVGMNWNGNTCTGEAKKFSFGDAQKQAGNGWRVPTIRELSSLIYCSSGKMQGSDNVGDGGAPIKNWCDGDYTKPTINTKAFPNTPASDVWSGSPYAGSTSYAWFVNFNDGVSSSYNRNVDVGVRLVRGGQ